MQHEQRAKRDWLSAKRPEAGQGLVEYALILVLVAVVVIVILSALGVNVSGVFCQVANTLRSGGNTQFSGTLDESHSHIVTLNEGDEVHISITSDYPVDVVMSAPGLGISSTYNGNSFTAPVSGDYEFIVSGGYFFGDTPTYTLTVSVGCATGPSES